MNKIRQNASVQWRSAKQDLREAITEEWQIAPGSLQLAAFCDDVLDLERDSERLLQRAEQLFKRSQQ